MKDGIKSVMYFAAEYFRSTSTSEASVAMLPFLLRSVRKAIGYDGRRRNGA